MPARTFLFVAGIFFTMICLAHLLRVMFGVDLVVGTYHIPMWGSGAAVVVMAYLAYEAFHQWAKSTH